MHPQRPPLPRMLLVGKHQPSLPATPLLLHGDYRLCPEGAGKGVWSIEIISWIEDQEMMIVHIYM